MIEWMLGAKFAEILIQLLIFDDDSFESVIYDMSVDWRMDGWING